MVNGVQQREPGGSHVHISGSGINGAKGEDEVSMMTVQCTLHKHLYGNLETTLESKIENIQNEDGSKFSVLHTWDQLSDVFAKSNSPSR